MPDLSIDEAREVSRATSSTIQLLQLHEIWVTTTGQSTWTTISGEVLGPMETIVAEMSELLSRCEHYGAELARIAEQHREEAEEMLMSLLWAGPLSHQDRSDLRWWSAQFGGVQAMAYTSAEILSGAGAERGSWRNLPFGDEETDQAFGHLSRAFQCGLAQNLIVGGILAIPAPISVDRATAATATLVPVACAGISLVSAGISYVRQMRC